MTEGHPILKVGLTGGIAAGKSTVAAFMRELGACIVDADDIARQVMRRGEEAYREVVERFGDGILDDSGFISRAELADIVFHDASALRELNRIVHPRIRAEIERRFEACAQREDVRIAVCDAALLVETGTHREMHKLIVVRCRPETQAERLGLRGGISEEQAAARISAQSSLLEKLAAADYIIDTDCSLDDTRRQTESVYAALLRDFHREFGT
jgi:dephospho-CoA kinase